MYANTRDVLEYSLGYLGLLDELTISGRVRTPPRCSAEFCDDVHVEIPTLSYLVSLFKS